MANNKERLSTILVNAAEAVNPDSAAKRAALVIGGTLSSGAEGATVVRKSESGLFNQFKSSPDPKITRESVSGVQGAIEGAITTYPDQSEPIAAVVSSFIQVLKNQT